MAQRKKKPTPRGATPIPGDDEMNLSKYVTTRQAAEMLGTDDSNIRHLLTEERLRGKRMGHYWLVYTPSLEKYLAKKSKRGRPPSGKPTIQVEDKTNGQE